MRHPPEVCCPSWAGPTSAPFQSTKNLASRRQELKAFRRIRAYAPITSLRILFSSPSIPAAVFALSLPPALFSFSRVKSFSAPDHAGTSILSSERLYVWKQAPNNVLDSIGIIQARGLSSSHQSLSDYFGGRSTGWSSLRYARARGEALSGHMLRPFSASPSAQCPPTTQQTFSNQAHLWACLLQGVRKACLCWVVLCCRRESSPCRPYPHLLGDSVPGCWTQFTGGHSRWLPLGRTSRLSLRQDEAQQSWDR